MNKLPRLILIIFIISVCGLSHAETKKKGKELLLEKREENLIKRQGLTLPEIKTQSGAPVQEVAVDTSTAKDAGKSEPPPKSEDRRISVGDRTFNLSELGPDDYIRFPEEEGIKEVNGKSFKFWETIHIKASKTRKKFARIHDEWHMTESPADTELTVYDDANRQLFRKKYTDGIDPIYFFKNDEYILLRTGGNWREPVMELLDRKGNVIYQDKNARPSGIFPSQTAFLYVKSYAENTDKYTAFKYDLDTKNAIKIIDTNYLWYDPTFSKTGDYCFYANGKILGYNNSDNLIWQMDYEDKGAGVSRSYSDNNKYFLFRQGSNFKLIDNTTGDIIWEKEVKEVKRDGAVYQIIGGGLSENDTIRVPLRNSNNLEEFKKYDIFALFDLEWNLTGFTKTEKKRR